MIDDRIPELNIERISDGIGEGLILLEQDSGGNVERVAIHPIHLRYMTEKLGLVETSDPQAAKTIATLKRRLRVLRDRADHLADWFATESDKGLTNRDYEMSYAIATLDIANEFCAEIKESGK